MKKLMTMIAAVASAFGLYAADTDIISGAAFDTEDPGLSAGTLTWQATGSFLTTYWSGIEGTMTPTEGDASWDKGTITRPSGFIDPNKDQYMAVKTTLGNPAFMSVLPTSKQEIGAGLYFDGLVKFTAFDETPQEYDGKIAVYLKISEDESETNLFVRAAGQTAGSTNDYPVVVSGGIAPETWYRLTIKAIEDIDTAAGNKVAFMVFVDKNAVMSGDAIISSGLKPQYANWGSAGKLFVSLGGDDNEIEGVGFDGQGAIDDIVFTTNAPDFAEDQDYFTFNWVDGVTEIACDVLDFSTNGLTGAGSYSVLNASKVEIDADDITAKCAADDKMIDAITIAADGESATITVKDSGAVVTIGGETFKFTANDIAGILNKMNGAASDATLKLVTDVNGALTFDNENDDVKMVLDLAGKTITGTENGVAIGLNLGELTITNSTTEVGSVVAVGDTGLAVSSESDGTMFITAGIFDGKVNGEVVSLYITGGEFLASANEPEDLEEFKVTGETRSFLKDGDYLVLGTAVAQIEGKGKFTSLAAAVAAVDDNETIKMLENHAYTGTWVLDGKTGVTLDLNDKTLTAASGYAFQLTGDAALAITNGTFEVSGTGTFMKIFGSSELTIEDGATLNMTNMTTCCIVNFETNSVGTMAGTVTMNGGTISGKNHKTHDEGTSGYELVRVKSGCTFVMNGGTIDLGPKKEGDAGTFYAITIAEGAKAVTLNGGAINGAIDNKSTLTGIIPGTSKATFDRDQTAFCETDYKTKIVSGTRYSVVLIDYATLTITQVEHCTISVTNAAGEAQITGATFDKDDATKLYVTRTPGQGYKLAAGCLAEETITMDDNREVTAVVEAEQTEPIPVPADNPTAVSNALESAGIPLDNPIYKTVTTAADVEALNTLLKANSVTDAKTLTATQQQYLNDSFLMKDVIGALLENEAKIEITEVSTTGFSLAIKVGANPATIKTTAADFLKGKVVAGAALDNMKSISAGQVTVVSYDAAAGTASFTLTYGDATSGFLKVVVTK